MTGHVLLLGAERTVARGTKNSLEAAGWTVIGADEGDDVLKAVERSSPDLVFAGTDRAVLKLTRRRSEIRKRGADVFLPRWHVIDNCQDKWTSYKMFRLAKVPVPDTVLARKLNSLPYDKVHVRQREGGGGYRSFSGCKRAAQMWLDHVNGHHSFTAAEWLPGPTVTWQGIYADGKLYASQQRKRLEWTHGDRGSALLSETYSDAIHNKVALDAIFAVDLFPHGVYGVDMTLDADGNPRVTEINVGRFFTTIEFFTQAGVNFPDIACRLGLKETVEPVGSNPLPNGLRWQRRMDAPPELIEPHTAEEKALIRDWWGALPVTGACPY